MLSFRKHFLVDVLELSRLNLEGFLTSSSGCDGSFFPGPARSVLARRPSGATSVAPLMSFPLNESELVFQTDLDLSLCTVGTSSAFLQTADNICLLTCTVTCRTLLPLPPPTLSPPTSGHSRSTKLPTETPEHTVPSPQAASSQCKLKQHFILSRLD